jgi:hypothetical protein
LQYLSFKGVVVVFDKPIQISVESALARASRSRTRNVDISIALALATGNEDAYIISFSWSGSPLIEVHLLCTASFLRKARVIAYEALKNMVTDDREALLSSVAKFLKYIHVDPQILNTIL